MTCCQVQHTRSGKECLQYTCSIRKEESTRHAVLMVDRNTELSLGSYYESTLHKDSERFPLSLGKRLSYTCLPRLRILGSPYSPWVYLSTFLKWEFLRRGLPLNNGNPSLILNVKQSDFLGNTLLSKIEKTSALFTSSQFPIPEIIPIVLSLI